MASPQSWWRDGRRSSIGKRSRSVSLERFGAIQGRLREDDCPTHRLTPFVFSFPCFGGRQTHLKCVSQLVLARGVLRFPVHVPICRIFSGPQESARGELESPNRFPSAIDTTLESRFIPDGVASTC